VTTPTQQTGQLRLPGVDVLRGLAVLFVLLHHIHLRFELNDYDTDDWLSHALNQVFWWSGYQAVITFFVISGFLITRLSISRWGPLGHIHIRGFYTLRVARIVPCLLLLLAMLTALHLMGAPNFTIPSDRASLGRALLAALTFHVNYLEGHHGYLPGGWDILWSLSIEETFYLLFPLICALLRSERLLVAPLLGLIIVGPISRTLLADHDPWGDYAYFSCTDGIAFGCLAALACARLQIPGWCSRAALTAGTAGALFVLVMRETIARLGLTDLGLHVTVLELSVALMLVAFGTDVGNRAASFSTVWLRRIGHHSYETYLFHMIVVLGLMNLLLRMRTTSHMLPVWFAAMLLLSLCLGELVARRYSEPLNRGLRSRFVRVASGVS
jgi:peptidoglycan/LPS O-acetylase OafA/YrhL